MITKKQAIYTFRGTRFLELPSITIDYMLDK